MTNLFHINWSVDYEVILRSFIVYLFMITALRLAGKKELSQLSTTDLVFIILISNAVQNAMVGENTSLLGGILAASTLFLANYLFKLLMYRSQSVKNLVEGEPVLLVHDGKLLNENLEHLKLSVGELQEVVREHGVEDYTKVKLAIMEVDGNISVISTDAGTVKHTHHKRKKVHKNYMGN